VLVKPGTGGGGGAGSPKGREHDNWGWGNQRAPQKHPNNVALENKKTPTSFKQGVTWCQQKRKLPSGLIGRDLGSVGVRGYEAGALGKKKIPK